MIRRCIKAACILEVTAVCSKLWRETIQGDTLQLMNVWHTWSHKPNVSSGVEWKGDQVKYLQKEDNPAEEKHKKQGKNVKPLSKSKRSKSKEQQVNK